MFPTGFIEVCSLGVQKVIFGGFDKINFFFKLLTMANILRIQKKFPKILFFDGAESVA
jgi:hypothetical protein